MYVWELIVTGLHLWHVNKFCCPFRNSLQRSWFESLATQAWHPVPFLTGHSPLPALQVSGAGCLHFLVPGRGRVTYALPATHLRPILWTGNWSHQARHGSWWWCRKLGAPPSHQTSAAEWLGWVLDMEPPSPVSLASWKSVIFPLSCEFKSQCLCLQLGTLLQAFSRTVSLRVLLGNLTFLWGHILTVSAHWWADSCWIQNPCGWVLGICISNKTQACIIFRYSKI